MLHFYISSEDLFTYSFDMLFLNVFLRVSGFMLITYLLLTLPHMLTEEQSMEVYQ